MKTEHLYPKYSLYAYRQINGATLEAFTPYTNTILVNAGELKVLRNPFFKPKKPVYIVLLSWLPNFRLFFPDDVTLIYRKEVERGKMPLVYEFKPDSNVVICEPLDVNYFMSRY